LTEVTKHVRTMEGLDRDVRFVLVAEFAIGIG
jgi:hypothetical protein